MGEWKLGPKSCFVIYILHHCFLSSYTNQKPNKNKNAYANSKSYALWLRFSTLENCGIRTCVCICSSRVSHLCQSCRWIHLREIVHVMNIPENVLEIWTVIHIYNKVLKILGFFWQIMFNRLQNLKVLKVPVVCRFPNIVAYTLGLAGRETITYATPLCLAWKVWGSNVRKLSHFWNSTFIKTLP